MEKKGGGSLAIKLPSTSAKAKEADDDVLARRYVLQCRSVLDAAAG